MTWLMEKLYILGEGQWPTEPNNSGYTEMGHRTPSYRGAYFETPIGYHAEVTWRLEQCGKDGVLAYQHYVESIDELILADLKNSTPGKIRRRCRRVLAYISGFNRKDRMYDEFRRSYSPKYQR